MSTRRTPVQTKNVCEDRVGGRKNIPEFVRAVSHNICVGQPNI